MQRNPCCDQSEGARRSGWRRGRAHACKAGLHRRMRSGDRGVSAARCERSVAAHVTYQEQR
eukprot:7120681-Prymnesium_polylepis.1